MASRIAGALLAALLLAGVPAVLIGQEATRPGTEFSGILFLHYRYGGATGERSQNTFDLDRAYLVAASRLSDRLSLRLTIDAFQQRDPARSTYYGGWAMRVKHAWLRYDFLKSSDNGAGLAAEARMGMINTIIIPVVEDFWPRWLASTATDRAGFFQSADMGGAVTVNLPGSFGDVQVAAVNGNGYQSRETDRFKDFALRAAITPFGASDSVLLGSLVIAPWIWKGARASDFAEGEGTVLPVSESRVRDRAGVFAGLSARGSSLGLEFATRTDVVETADTGVDLVPTVLEVDGRLLSGFVHLKPLAFTGDRADHPFGVLVRLDHITPDTESDSEYYRFLIAGITWDLGRHASIALDYQEQSPQGAPVASTRVFFLQAVARF